MPMPLPLDELKYLIEVAEALSTEANGFGRLVAASIEVEIGGHSATLTYANDAWGLTADQEIGE
jgi:hypothetical protein